MTFPVRMLSIVVVFLVSGGVGACKSERKLAGPAPEPIAQTATIPREAPAKPVPPEPPPAKEPPPAATADAAPVHEVLSLRIDGIEAEYVGPGEPAASVSHWKVPHPVASVPNFAYELSEPRALGSIRTVTLKFYPKYKGDYATIPAPVIVSVDPDFQLKPSVEYKLGALGDDFKVMDARGGAARRFALRPGFEYRMEVVFDSEPSHTAVVFMQVAE